MQLYLITWHKGLSYMKLFLLSLFNSMGYMILIFILLTRIGLRHAIIFICMHRKDIDIDTDIDIAKAIDKEEDIDIDIDRIIRSKDRLFSGARVLPIWPLLPVSPSSECPKS